MKKAFFFLFILCNTFLMGQTQTSNTQEIEEIARQIFKATENKDYNTLLDYTYPRIFEMVQKPQMLELLQYLFEGNESMQITSFPIVSDLTFSPIYENDSLQYAYVAYPLDMQIKYTDQKFTAEEQQSILHNLTQEYIEGKFLNANTLELHKRNAIMIFIKDDYSKQKWTSSNYSQQNNYIQQLIPPYILEGAEQFQTQLNQRSTPQNTQNTSPIKSTS